MTTPTISNWLLPTPEFMRAKLALPAGSRHKRESFNPIELTRSLSRWENEGGAIKENNPAPAISGTAIG